LLYQLANRRPVLGNPLTLLGGSLLTPRGFNAVQCLPASAQCVYSSLPGMGYLPAEFRSERPVAVALHQGPQIADWTAADFPGLQPGREFVEHRLRHLGTGAQHSSSHHPLLGIKPRWKNQIFTTTTFLARRLPISRIFRWWFYSVILNPFL